MDQVHDIFNTLMQNKKFDTKKSFDTATIKLQAIVNSNNTFNFTIQLAVIFSHP